MQLASFSLAEVTYATGDIAYLVHQQARSASFKVRAKQENVSGVVLPAFEVDRVPGTGTLSPPSPQSRLRSSPNCEPLFFKLRL
jgi:vacuolar-type H+-ATPase subunit D/Vma8